MREISADPAASTTAKLRAVETHLRTHEAHRSDNAGQDNADSAGLPPLFAGLRESFLFFREIWY